MPQQQLYRYTTFGIFPSLTRSSYTTFCGTTSPYAHTLLCQFNTTNYLIAKPSTLLGDKYPAASALIFNTIHNMFLQKLSIHEVVKPLKCQLVSLLSWPIPSVCRSSTSGYPMKVLLGVIIGPSCFLLCLLAGIMYRLKRRLVNQIRDLETKVAFAATRTLNDTELRVVDEVMGAPLEGDPMNGGQHGGQNGGNGGQSGSQLHGLLDLRIDPTHLTCLRVLGEGAFGSVYEAILYKHHGPSPSSPISPISSPPPPSSTNNIRSPSPVGKKSIGGGAVVGDDRPSQQQGVGNSGALSSFTTLNPSFSLPGGNTRVNNNGPPTGNNPGIYIWHII